MVRTYLPVILTLYVAFVFIQSLFFKFTGSPETAHIFGTLDDWAAGFGLEGIFAPGGIASQYVVGTTELIASALLLAGLVPALRFLQPVGALIGLGVISGAIFFHLFTPLGVVVANEATGVESDGGLLFGMAIGVWIANAVLLILNKDRILGLLGGGTAKAA